MMGNPGICFIIAPIGQPGSDVRKRSDQVFKFIIAPSVEECGYSPVRADQIADPGLITNRVVKHLVEDPMVVADLTGRNPNVFYELAVRHLVRKPLVQIMAEGEALPFDVAGTRTIRVDHHDLDSVSEARAELERQIRASQKEEAGFDSPISIAIDVQHLLRGRKPEQRSLADLVTAMSDIRTSMLSIQERIRSPSSLFPRSYFQQLVESSSLARSKSARTAAELRHVSQDLFLQLAKEIKSKRGQEKLAKISEYIEHIANTLVE